MRVCIIIGEGKSERTFLPSLLMEKFNFHAYNEKNCILYQLADSDLYWIFPFPSLGQIHQGGWKKLQNEDTYIKAKTVVDCNRHIFGEYPLRHYRIITDTDNLNNQSLRERVEVMENALKKTGIFSDSKICLANNEIESWFIAGLTKENPLIDKNISDSDLRKFMAKNPETIVDAKEKLDDILKPEIRGDRQKIGAEFGRLIDLDQAVQKSKSLKDFLRSLKEDSLI